MTTVKVPYTTPSGEQREVEVMPGADLAELDNGLRTALVKERQMAPHVNANALRRSGQDWLGRATKGGA